jgi:hypothetical protein
MQRHLTVFSHFFILSVLLALGFTLAGAERVTATAPIQTIRVSVAQDGTQGNHASTEAAISANGRYLAFVSDADNLVAGDDNLYADIFVRNQKTGELVRMPEYGFNITMSGDGRWLAYISVHVVVHDRDTDKDGIFDEPGTSTSIPTTIHREGHNITYGIVGRSPTVSLSRDGRFLVSSVLYKDIDTSETTTGIFLLDLTSGSSQMNWILDGFNPVISPTGRYIAYAACSSGSASACSAYDVYELDRDTDVDGIFDEPGNTSTLMVSVNPQGDPGDHDSGFGPKIAISDDGRFVIFNSAADNLVEGGVFGEQNVFIRDILNSKTSQVSTPIMGGSANGSSSVAAVSANGRYVLYGSSADNLIENDTNGKEDYFLWDRIKGTTLLVSAASDSTQADDNSYSGASMSSDGSLIAFASDATNLIPDDTNQVRDVFLREVPVPHSYLIQLPLIIRQP